jgi:molybdate-binding protein/transcriptional regulator with XRE-family HTH domain
VISDAPRFSGASGYAIIRAGLTSIMVKPGDTLRRARAARGLSQAELARRAGISRQALSAIESDAYQPSVAVALSLARELGGSVESLFGGGESETPRQVDAMWSGREPAGGQAPVRVSLARIGGKVIAVPRPAAFLALAPAAGMLINLRGKQAEVSTFRPPAEIDRTLVVAGCDPGVAILGDWLSRMRSPVFAAALSCSSANALAALAEGRAHAAGVHLRDPKSGEYNLGSARRTVARRPAIVVNFARWELGLATAPGNPLSIRGIADLGRRGVRIVNRETGSGARAALDEAIAELGLNTERIDGYRTELGGHLEVAAAVAGAQSNAGITIRVAADAYRLNFVPIREERYDLVILESEEDSAPVKAMMDALNSRRFAAEVGRMCAYDTDCMGDVIARIR